MKYKILLGFYIVLVTISFESCKKEQEIFSSEKMLDYFPLGVGKTFLYRLDSIVPSSGGLTLLTRPYLAKDSIEATFNDNHGRLSYRIFRLIRDTAQTQSWRFAGTYVATPTNEWIEYVDNNMRFIKLHSPVSNGYVWKAHSFIDTKSLNSTVPYLDEWEYQYQDFGETYTVLNNTYDSTIAVLQQDETTPDGPFDPNNYQQRNYGIEVYAKGVGLIYKDFLHWTWQTTPNGNYEDGSYGLRLQLISHN